MLRNSSLASLSLTLACASPMLLSVSGVASAQPTNAPSVVVRSLSGDVIRLSIGEADGAKVGDVYTLTRSNTTAKIQIFQVEANQSQACILGEGVDFVVTVGDTAKYAGNEPLGASPSDSSLPTSTLPEAPIVAVRGTDITLGIGSKDGVVPGAIFITPTKGDEQARMIVKTVRQGESTAILQNVTEGFTLTVGEMARFVAIGTLPEMLVPEAPKNTPTVKSSPTNTATSNSAAIPIPVSITGSTATVTSLSGNTIFISAGSNQGVKAGQTVPVLRSGAIIGLARIVTITEVDATAFVLWSDENQGAITTGDAVGILGSPSPIGVPPLDSSPLKIPSVLVKYESGASNASVPKADPTYDLLAALAATGMITSQPARVFQDDGARRHNASEDVIFSRAQIAGFIREAMKNYKGGGGRDGAALSLLVKDYGTDLIAQGVPKEQLDKIGTKNFQIGVSTFSRATVTGGDNKAENLDPFAERFGARRSKSGFDTRVNLFGTLNKDINLYGSVDIGSRIREDGDKDTEVRKLYLQYDAKSLLRGLSIEVGRKEFWWGPGQFGTTTLGDAAGGLDSFHTSFKRGSYELEGLYSRLGKGPAGAPRSLYGQNFSVRIGKQAKIGVTNTLLSPNDSFDPKLFAGALSPIPLYLVDRSTDSDKQGDNSKTNALVGAYGELAIAKGARIYGELALDDFSANGNNKIENRDGSLVGLQLFDPKDPTKLGFKFEYARFNSYAYIHREFSVVQTPDYDYYQNGSPLGYPISPLFPSALGGAESLRLEAYFKPARRWWLNGGLEFSDLNAEDQNSTDGGTRGFSRQQIYRFSAAYDLTRNWSLTGRVQRVATDQPNFIKNEPSVTDRFFSLEIGKSF